MSRVCAILALMPALLPFCHVAQAVEPVSSMSPTVILIAWSGARHDYPDLDNFPGIERLKAEGARATGLMPVYPSDTYPNYVSMSTGAYPDVHGIIANNFHDRVRGYYQHEEAPTSDWLEAEPLWIAAERQHVKAAVDSWIGAEDRWRGQQASYRQSTYLKSKAESAKVRQILAWLDLPEEERPRLIMSQWTGTNFLAIRQGPDHAGVKERVQKHDKQLLSLLKGIDKRGLWPTTTLFLVSDHGMTEISQFIDIDEILKAAGIDAETAGGPSLQHIYLDDPADLESAYAALSANSHLRVRRSEWAIGARLAHKTRLGDLIATVGPPYSLISPAKRLLSLHGVMAKLRGWRLGMHGYDADHADMAGIFLTMGRGVQPGLRLPTVRIIDIAPTVASLLNIQPPSQSEGRVLNLAP